MLGALKAGQGEATYETQTAISLWVYGGTNANAEDIGREWQAFKEWQKQGKNMRLFI